MANGVISQFLDFSIPPTIQGQLRKNGQRKYKQHNLTEAKCQISITTKLSLKIVENSAKKLYIRLHDDALFIPA